MDGLTERQRLEEDWRERVIAARQRYQGARHGCRGAFGNREPCRSSGAGESEALAEYAMALDAFANLVLRGRLP